MYALHATGLAALLEDVLGSARARRVFSTLEVPTELLGVTDQRFDRAQLAFALTAVLFDDVLRRVPMADAYAGDARREQRRLRFDHGALRTVAAPSGELPPGRFSIARILEPLGYEQRGVYPLDRLGMTGFAYAHAERPEQIPQFFVSELHPERFSEDFQQAVHRVVGQSADPLPMWAQTYLDELVEVGYLPRQAAARLLPMLAACFDRHHAEPSLADYELLRDESAEMAWIATEGQAFNHATDRVEDVEAVAQHQRELGRPIKPELEVSQSGRVVQTAFRAATVERLFVDEHGHLVSRWVPGSFHEFISRAERVPGELDLAFDSSNAQGIFKMTSGEGAEDEEVSQ